jgi:hypothetical protein
MISDTSPRPISPLRARMIEDMTVRGFKEDTRRDYVRHVRAFAAFIGRSPDTATAEDLRLFQLHQTRIGMQPPSINSAASALRFFFTVTLDRSDLARRLTVVPYPRRIPAVLSVEEVTLLLRAATAPKYKAAFATAGACPRAGQGRTRGVLGCASRRLSRSRPATSIPSACCCASSAARAARACPRESGGSPCNAVATAARAAVGPPTLPRRPCRRPGRGNQEARVATHAAAQFRHPPPRAGCRYSRDSDASGPRQTRHHSALYPSRQYHDPGGNQP